MDQDEEEEDFAEEEEEEEEEDDDIFNKDKKKIFGDTKHYCPVMLKEKDVLWPGMSDCASKYRERTYFFSSLDARATFLDDPEVYLSVDKPLQVTKVFRFDLWPNRLPNRSKFTKLGREKLSSTRVQMFSWTKVNTSRRKWVAKRNAS